MLEKNPDTLKIAFKNFPINSHKMARPAAQAAQAANLQGLFWQYHDKVFEDYKNLSDEKFITIAQEVGLDLDRFRKDMNSPETQQLINRDMNDAANAGVRGTPTLYLNGRLVKDRSPAGLQSMIDAELRKLKKK
ncbi:MAG: thioredoxin domain-containing protein [Proteobacteria bacterium]|nr:thioredoxin domain-containing protein [Pseudomonadota bacterium]